MVKPAYAAIHDANGFNPVDSFIETSFGGAYDRQRMVLRYEVQELETEFAPKTQKAGNDLSCMRAAEEALSLMQAQINKIPQPSWVSDPAQFSTKMNLYFDAAARANDVPKARMDSAVDRYDLAPQSKDDVSGKINLVNQQIAQMDALVNNIDSKFNELAQLAQSPQEFKALSQMGITSIDGIYAIDPGRFVPKDGDGRPTQYDPKNLIHALQAIEHFLENPALATMEGMRLFGPRAINELREVMRDDYGAKPQNGLGRAPEGVLAPDPNGRFAPPPRNPDDPNNDDPNNPNSRTRRMVPGLGIGYLG